MGALIFERGKEEKEKRMKECLQSSWRVSMPRASLATEKVKGYAFVIKNNLYATMARQTRQPEQIKIVIKMKPGRAVRNSFSPKIIKRRGKKKG
jgi:hypothetical protein